MSDRKKYPEQNEVKKLLKYCPDTSIFIWLTGQRKGERAGKICKGYIDITIKRSIYKAHILARIYMYGCDPTLQIDHIDKNGLNNRIHNLRLATREQNQANRYTSSFHGVKGVMYDHRTAKWRAKITLNGKTYRFGPYKTKEKAHERYMIEARKYFGEFASDGKRTNE